MRLGRPVAAAAFAALALGAPASARIASLNLCTDELLLHLAPANRIASVSYLSHSPHEANFWREARRHPANDGSVLGVARYRPKVILTMGGAGRDGARLARALGAQLIVLPFPDSLDDVASAARRVAGLAGNGTAGEHFAARIDALKRTASQPRPALFLSGAGDVQMAGTLGAAWLRLAGYAAPPGTPARVGLEDLLLRPPPLLIRSRYRARQVSANTRWQAHPAWRRLGRIPVLATDGRRWTCMGPSLVAEILRLRRARP